MNTWLVSPSFSFFSLILSKSISLFFFLREREREFHFSLWLVSDSKMLKRFTKSVRSNKSCTPTILNLGKDSWLKLSSFSFFSSDDRTCLLGTDTSINEWTCRPNFHSIWTFISSVHLLIFFTSNLFLERFIQACCLLLQMVYFGWQVWVMTINVINQFLLVRFHLFLNFVKERFTITWIGLVDGALS